MRDFLNLDAVGLWGQVTIWGVLFCASYIFSSIPDLYPLGATSIPPAVVTTKNVPEEQYCHLLRTTDYEAMIKKNRRIGLCNLENQKSSRNGSCIRISAQPDRNYG